MADNEIPPTLQELADLKAKLPTPTNWVWLNTGRWDVPCRMLREPRRDPPYYLREDEPILPGRLPLIEFRLRIYRNGNDGPVYRWVYEGSVLLEPLPGSW